MKMLNDKERSVINAYFGKAQFDQAEAVRMSLYKCKKPNNMTGEFFARPHVVEELERRRQELAKDSRKDAMWLLNRLVQEAEADLADLFDDLGDVRPVSEWPLIWRQGLVTGIENKQCYRFVNGKKEEDGYIVKLRLANRVKQLELIGKHIEVRAFTDDSTPTVPTINLVVNRSDIGVDITGSGKSGGTG